MKKLLMLALPLLVVFALTTPAHAVNTYTLLAPELFSLVELWDNPVGVGDLDSVSYDSGGVWYVGDILNHATQWRQIYLGDSTPPVTDLSLYTGYALKFENKDNNDPWSVNVFMKTGAGSTYYASPWVNLSPGGTGVAYLDFSVGGVSNINDIKAIGFGIGYNGSSPGPGGTYQGDQYNILVHAIPEPGSMMLLGLGALGLFGLRKRKS